MAHTRPDMSDAISVVSQFIHAPSIEYRNVVDCILRYLNAAMGKWLMFSKHGHLDVSGYTDADRVVSITDRRLTSGNFTFVGGNLIT